jgi:hypothetical protein
MAFKHKYTLICDEVRQENTGKLLVIGLYLDNMGVSQIPFMLPSLTFLFAFENDRLGDYPFRAKLENLESGKVLAQAMGVLQVLRPGTAINILGFRNISIDRIGTYTMSLTMDGERDPVTASIEVVLQAQLLNPPQPQM